MNSLQIPAEQGSRSPETGSQQFESTTIRHPRRCIEAYSVTRTRRDHPSRALRDDLLPDFFSGQMLFRLFSVHRQDICRGTPQIWVLGRHPERTRPMLTSFSSATPRMFHPLAVVPVLRHWCQARIAAYQARVGRRRSMALLRALREHHPRLFEETRLDPIELPPPGLDALSLLPPVVISTYILGDRPKS